ncbi:MAG: hypothetical protein MUE40_18345 [Anaerolineae bacterium]|jgi:hypothetical protein|nr:hypothetical protein [Anaerolineae bacterium]
MAIKEAEFFVDGEKHLGHYTVFILQQSNANWLPAVLPLDAVVTNFRLLLRPTRKKYAPATLPGYYIKHIEMSKRGFYHCVALLLVTGHELYLLPGTGKLENFYDDLCLLKVPPPRFTFDERVASHDIQRLISFFRDPVQ